MKKLAAVFFTLLFASTASAQVITNPSTNARMDGLGVANWQIEDDFNIWINPAQVSNYKNTIYGELGTEITSSPCTNNTSFGECGAVSGTGFNDSVYSGSQWGGMNMDVSYGEWGVYIGRPYAGVGPFAASPLGLPSFGLAGPLVLFEAGSPPTTNRVDLFYGLHSAQPIGLYLSYADQSEKNTVGGVTAKDESTEWNIGAGGIFGGGMLDGAINITFPSSKCSDAAGTQTNCGDAFGGNTLKSDASPSFSILARHHANMGNSKLLTTAQILTIDASVKDSVTSQKIKDNTLGWRIDTALNSKPIPDALVIVGIGLAGANREIKFNQGGGKNTFDDLAIPVNVALEHQTFKAVKTRIGLSKPLYNKSNCKDTAPQTGDCTGNFTGGLDKANVVSDGAANFSMGLGWTVMDNLSIDAVLNQDVLFTGTYMISGVPETLSSKLSATYRFK
jgi:hypothetical protein